MRSDCVSAELVYSGGMPTPRICLCMIVRNEEAVIDRCLDSVLPWASLLCIVDTGSTDRTKEKILQAAKRHGVHGKLYDAPWVDYSHNRNQALGYARELLEDTDPASDSWLDYIMVMDADDVLSKPSMAGEYTLDFPGNAEGYLAHYKLGELEFDRTILLRADVPWKYHFPVHETLMRREGDALDLPHSGLHVDCNVGGSRKSPEHYMEHARILERYLLEHPDCARSQFYLAQSYHCAGATHMAIRAYAKRTQMGGWTEEVLVSWLRIGELSDDPGAYLEASALNTTRVEGLYGFAQWCFKRGMDGLGKEALLEATVSLFDNKPTGLFVDSSVHKWKVAKLYAETFKAQLWAKMVVRTPGAEYGPELLSLARGET